MRWPFVQVAEEVAASEGTVRQIFEERSPHGKRVAESNPRSGSPG
jgi:hypothetical protein